MPEKKPSKSHAKKISVGYILLAVWGVLLLQSLISSQYAPVRIPYSEFIAALNQDRVIEVAITTNEISGTMLRAPEAQGTQGFQGFQDAQGQGGAQSLAAPPAGSAAEDVPPDQLVETRFTTVRVEPDFSRQLEEHDIVYKGEVESTFFRDLLSWIVPVALFAGVWYWLMRRLSPGGAMMQFGKNKAKIFAEKEVETSFEDVAGLSEAKTELNEVVDFLKDSTKYTRLGGRLPKGILLVGPPGTGKTLLARAVAGEAGVPFFSISGSEFVELFVGMGASRVRDLFQQAREKSPCIIFIDELDAIGKARGGGNISGHDEREQTLNQLLAEMDGFDPRTGVVIMAATNRPESLDQALLRAGRFDRQVLVDRPDINGREAILKVHITKIRAAEDVDLTTLARKTPGFSGADLANIINEAALLAARENKDAVQMVDLEKAVDRITGGLEKKNRVINPREKKVVAYHETGHALTAALTTGADPVHKISIVPTGLAALGYTQQLPTEDRYLMSRKELVIKIDVMLGGRVAEQITFPEVTTGAHNDLSRATDVARAMVTEYGMGETLGLSAYPKRNQPTFLSSGEFSPGGKEYSESTAAKIDEEVKAILAEREKHVKELLSAHKDLLAKVAETLLDKEILTKDEFMELVGDLAAPGPDEDETIMPKSSNGKRA